MCTANRTTILVNEDSGEISRLRTGKIPQASNRRDLEIRPENCTGLKEAITAG